MVLTQNKATGTERMHKRGLLMVKFSWKLLCELCTRGRGLLTTDTDTDTEQPCARAHGLYTHLQLK